jgi:hypothetical protein
MAPADDRRFRERDGVDQLAATQVEQAEVHGRQLKDVHAALGARLDPRKDVVV